MRLLAIDPGNHESGWVVINSEDCRPLRFGKTLNQDLRDMILSDAFADCTESWIEMIGHYGTGMHAGVTVFDTCVWIGRFIEALRFMEEDPVEPSIVLRASIKTHICGVAKAKDPNVRQALIDRFAPGQPNHGKGTKAEPGWFYGFRADIWQAYALAVYAADNHHKRGML